MRRLVFGHPTLIYLGSIAVLTTILLAAGATWVWRLDHALPMLLLTLALLAVPAVDIAAACVQRLIARWVAPRRLPRHVIDVMELRIG